ncbi:Fungalysin metallopeptidase-domain-containing protein [Mycena leptocephala]|nr:Fungalysin metallopeptidase-domain-containing protein [Mycena leptocephala]
MLSLLASSPSGVRPATVPAACTPGRTNLRHIGAVWANMLHNVHAALVDAHEFLKTARTDPTGSEGNVIWLHLFIDALALQPCQPDLNNRNPVILQARDAWIQADQNRYAGANKCLLWKTFASRGMGFNTFDYTDDFSVPAGC